ncbi:hypothetical protein [Nocardia asiatica]|uniref:hypothetical protein n=1 Tax=Nocardia asiatica TaxID=209252 RepID=UPI002455F04B|nr:hypothetical protein [Nocardia asiatica]
MTLIRIYVRSDGAELDVREEETVSLKSEPETERLARIMRRVLGKVERALNFGTAAGTPAITVPIELLGKIQYVPLDKLEALRATAPAPAAEPDDSVPFPELPAPTSWRGSGEPSWEVHADWRDTTASISPTAPINRDDADIPTIGIYLRDGVSKWTYPEARALALSILAATEWKQEDDNATGGPQ